MQLGVTIPLQKFLKIPRPPYGELVDLFFCWEIHKIPDSRYSTLIAVNAFNRYALVFSGMQAKCWKHIPEIVIDGIRQALTYDGFKAEQIEIYLAAAGDPELTKTHGRKPVAGLNRAVEYFYWLEDDLRQSEQLYQTALSDKLNLELCHVVLRAKTTFCQSISLRRICKITP